MGKVWVAGCDQPPEVYFVKEAGERYMFFAIQIVKISKIRNKNLKQIKLQSR